MVGEKLITREEAVLRVEPASRAMSTGPGKVEPRGHLVTSSCPSASTENGGLSVTATSVCPAERVTAAPSTVAVPLAPTSAALTAEPAAVVLLDGVPVLAIRVVPEFEVPQLVCVAATA
jgi:hypothetical protein